MSRYGLLTSLITTLLIAIGSLTGIAQPIIGASPASVSVTISDCNDSITVPVTITNTGSAPLNFLAGDVRFALDSVYFGNQGGANVEVIDANAQAVVGGTVTTGGNPMRSQISADGTQLWVSNNWDNTVSVYDIATRGLLATTSVGGSGPTGITHSLDGTRAFVCNRWTGTIDVFSTTTFAITSTIIGLGAPQDVAISPDGRFLYVADSDFGFGLVKVDIGDGSIVAREASGTISGSHSIVLTPDGSTAYVSSSFSGSVYAVDTKTMTLISTIGGFSQGHGIDITPDGSLVYVCDMWGGRVAVIDVATNTILTSIFDARFSRCWDIVIDRRGEFAYVTDAFGSPDDVMIVDLGTNTIVSTITSTSGGSRGLATTNWPLGWVQPLTSSGTIAPGGSTVVSVRFYSAGMSNGTYTGYVTLDSDDPATPLLTIPVSLTVDGLAGMLVSDTCLFDTTIQESATIQDTFYLFNPGCDTLRITDILASLPEYTPDNTALNIPSCDTGRVIVTFAPLAPGNYTGTLTVESNAGDSLICLQGMAVAAPEITVAPDPVTASTTSCCDTVSTSITISNISGGAPLAFQIVPTATMTETFDPVNNPANWTSLTGGVEFVGCGADDGNAFFLNGGGARELITVPLNVSSGGFVDFRVYMSNGSDGCNAAENGEDVLLDYSIDNGGTWVNFGLYDEAVYTPSFSTVSEPIPFAAQTFTTMFRWRQRNHDCSGCDISMIDDIQVFSNSLIFASDTIDTIPALGSQVVDLFFVSCGQTSGTYTDSIQIITNDPRNPAYYLEYSYTINGSADFLLSDTCLDLDTVMQFNTNVDSFYIYNPGCDTLEVTGISNVLPEFSVDTMVFQIAPYDSFQVLVNFSPLIPGDYFDTLNVQTNVGDSLICLFGVGVEAPSISVLPDTLFVSTTNCCDTISAQITISNGSPVADLDWIIHTSGSISDNFNGGTNPALWQDIQLGATNGNCGSVTGDALHFNGGGANRWAQTIPLNTLGTTAVDFCIIFGTGGGSCENADGGEDVIFEYSTDNGVNFNNIQLLDEAVYTSWTCLSIPIPIAAQTNSTIFRWRQVAFSSCSGCDNWAMDDVAISTSSANIYADPDTATTGPSSSTLVDINFISCNSVSGVYFDSVLITSNDPLNPSYYLLYEFTLNGQPTSALSDTCLDFDSIMEFATTTDTFWVFNTGCDTLDVTNTANTLTEYSADTLTYNIAPGDSLPVLITFSPTSVGTYLDTFLLTTNGGDTSICMLGVATPRPIISYQPDTFNVTLSCADSIVDSLWIYNSGLVDLTYDIEGDSVQMLALTFGADLTGEYPNTIAAINTYFTKYVLTETGTTDPTTLANLLVDKDVLLIPEREFGALAVWTAFGPTLQAFANAGGTVIFCGSAAGQAPSMFTTGLFSGNFLGSSTGTATVVDNSTCITDSLSTTFTASSASFFVNITNPDAQNLVTLGGGQYVTMRPIGLGRAIYIGADFFVTNAESSRLISNAVRCFGGSLGSWANLSQAADTVPTLDSSLVEITFNSSGLTVGTYTSNLIINSNDPLSPCDTVILTLNVIGAPEMNFVSNCLDLDSIVEYSTFTDSLGIINTGCDTLFVSNITNVLPEYTLNTTNFFVVPGDTFNVGVTFSPTAVGTYNDTLTVFSTVGDSLICLTGDAFGRPIFDHLPDTLIVQMTGCCDTVDTTLMVYNNGLSPLLYTSTNCRSVPLDSVLSNFNSNHAAITATIPSVFAFIDGVVGTAIADGGGDMYDGGNSLNTDLGIFIPYSDNLVSPNAAFGPTGEYFTRKQPGIFFMAADLDGVSSFNISGNLGADGGGFQDSTRITLPFCGTHFTAYIKRVYSSGDPSVNHMIIFESDALGQTIGLSTDDDFHGITGITTTRMYYALFAHSLGSRIDDADMTIIFQSILDNVLSGGSALAQVTPISDTIPAGDSLQLNVSVDGCSLAADSTYLDSLAFNTNDPLNPIVYVPLVIIKDSLPPTPTANDTSICFGSPTPDLVVVHVGDSAVWYSDPTLTTPVFTGDIFATGETVIGTYTYYVTTWRDSCSSLADTVTLTINAAPLQPITADQVACFGAAIPDLLATGAGTLLWYDDGALTNLVFAGSPFATGQTGVGTYTYYVVDSIPGCPSGPSDTVSLTISPLPAMPVGTDVTVCEGQPVPDLTATGANLFWYSDPALTTLVFVGDPFPTGLTSAGVYNYYVTQTPGGCESPADTVTLTIISATPPVASDTSVCFGDPVPDLTATGSNLQWYDDIGLTNLVGTGSPFATGQSAVGVYTYYVTSTASGCESLPTVVTLIINAIPIQPTTSDETVCEGDPVPDLNALGVNVTWYDDGALTNIVSIGNLFTTGQTLPGTYTYYVTQAIGSCTGPSDTVTLTIVAQPAIPTASDETICFGQPTPDLTATGTNLLWYDDLAMTNLVNTGNTFATGQTAVGVYTYLVRDSINGCYGIPDTVVLTINNAPILPIAENDSACFGLPVPDLTSTGVNPGWFTDVALTTQVGSGNTFTTGQTAVGTYVYYVSDSLSGCPRGPTDTVRLFIHPVPAAPIGTNETSCFGDPVPDLTATGTNHNWYSDGGLTTLVGAGSPFVTGQIAPGVYTYYVTQTDGATGCESAADTVILTIFLTTPPLANDTASCFGFPTPDLTATGTNVQWYSDGGLTTLLFAGNPFTTGETAVGTYTYYVTQTLNGCESVADTVTLTINAIPAAPVSINDSVCFGSPAPDLTATGTNVQWYSDGGLTTLVNVGSPFATGQTAVGVHTYYVTQTVNGCESPADTISLVINPIPAPPVGTDLIVCFGDPVPDLTAIGTNLDWYSDGGLTTLVFSGNPFATGETAVGTYTYYVTQTTTGCPSMADPVTLTISTQPVTPVVADIEVCDGDPVPDLIAAGNIIQWYDDGALSNLVFTGSPFATGQTAVGNYTYYVTDSVAGCIASNSDTVVLTIHPIPAAPIANDTAVCEDNLIPDLTATGTNIQWYSDGGLTTLVFGGSPFATGETLPGTYTYYLTQTVNGCESPADTVTLIIHPDATAPIANDTAVCEDAIIPDLTATGTSIQWYSDGALTTLVATGSPYASGQTAVGTYTYYVTQTINGCESPADTVTLNINALPATVVASDQSVCEGQIVPDLTSTGTNVIWYDDAALTSVVGAGNLFSTGQTAAGTYIYYVTQTDGNNCESIPDTAVLTIFAIPAAPFAGDTTVCFGDPVPDLTATGSTIQWYSDGSLSTLVFSGNPFATGQTAVGTYTYYVTQTLSGCESLADTVSLTISTTPPSPVATDSTICEGDPTPTLSVASGSNVVWFSDGALTTIVGTGLTFTPAVSAAGTYNFYVTDSLNGCGQSLADTAVLVITPLPSAPVAADQSVCQGFPIPDLTATGTSIQWYDDGALTNLVFTGSPFATGQTAPGVYTYYVTQTVNNCEGPADTVTLTIFAIPAAPVAAYQSVCENVTIPDLTATGSNVQWYDDGALTNLVFTGSPFATGQTTAGTYTYYVTQTVNGCESPADTVTLTIYAIPAAPVAVDQSVCEGQPVPDLTSTGTNVQWYSDGGLTTLVGTGSPFVTGETTAGVYTYYVTQTDVNTCESLADTVTLTIFALPSAPIALDQSVCEGLPVPDLTAAGTNIQWYSDGGLTTLVGTGSPFATGETTPGVYTYYVTQTDANTCESLADTVTLTIYALPAAPVALDQSACFGQLIPDLTATGTNVQWYSDGSLTTLVGTGSPFATGETMAGTYTYYVTQTDANTCESLADTVTLTIYALPAAPVAVDQSVCEGQPVPDLTSTGTNVQWYSDGGLTTLVGTGSPFATGETTAGVYTYYVTQTDANTCESLADTVTLTIFALPSAPIALDQSVCEGLPVPDLTAAGTNIQWYSDGSLTTLVGTGSPFATGETTPGVYTYYVTQTDANTCESLADTVTLTIYALPAAPVALDQSACFGQLIPDLTATGTNVQWYSDGSLTTLVGTGSPFATGETTAGTYTYYVTQTDANTCESLADTVTLTIYALPAAPVALDQSVCEGQPVPDLTSTGTNVQWYSDGGLTTLVGTGSPFATGETTAGVYTYYVTQTDANTCESLADTVTLTIFALPSAPIALDQSVCEGLPVPDLTAAGTNIQWYSDGGLTTLVGTGSPFATGETTPGVYTYYVTQTDANTCESLADTVTLTIFALPAAPVGIDEVVCEGALIPDLTATGTSLQWYSDGSLTTLVASGSPFATGQTAPGIYTYYVTQSLNGCESVSDTVSLTINALPSPPIANDTAVCEDVVIPDLMATGTNLQWYDDGALTNLVFTGSPFATGQTAPGVYTYYVTQTDANTCESVADTVTLTINALPAAPTANDTAICFGNPTPDLTATGSNVLWYDDALLTNLVNSGSTFSTGQTALGTYVYYLRDSINGCYGPSDTVTLTITAAPGTPIVADTAICVGMPTPAFTTTGANLVWYDDVALTNQVGTGNSFTPPVSAVGVYTYYVTDSVNLCGQSPADTVVLTIFDYPSAPVSNDTTICASAQIPDLVATGGSNYQWYDDATLTNLVGTGANFASGQSSPGVYTYYVTASNGGLCEGPSDTVTLTILTAPVVVAGPDLTICAGDSIQLNASGGGVISYSWTPIATLDNANIANPWASPTVTTNYVVTGINAIGCEGYDTVMVNVQPGPCALVVNPSASAFTICAGECVDISANANHGTLPYQYTWNNSLPAIDGPHTVCPLTTTTYTVEVIDANDTVNAQITITVLPAPTVTASADTSLCSGDTIGISAVGGFTYAWTPSASMDDTTLSNPNVFPLSNTTYYVTTTALNGCSATDSLLVTVNVSAIPPAGVDEVACTSGIIPDLTATGTNVTWYDDPNLTNLVGSGSSFATGQTAPGTYDYYVIQLDTISGCNSIADTVTLIIGSAPLAVNASDTNGCAGGIIPDLTASGGNVQWFDDVALTNLVGSGNTFASGQSTAGTYVYYVVDSTFGCGVGPIDTVTLTISAPPVAPSLSDSSICFGQANPLWTVSGGTLVNWYTKPGATQWVHTGSSFAADETAVGTWTYYVNDSTPGCAVSPYDTVTLVINPNPLVTLNTYSTSILPGDSVELMAFNASNYSWTPPTGLSATTGWNVWASPIVTTTYTVTGTNDYGCTADTTVTVFIGTVGLETFDGIFSALNIYPNPSFGEFNVTFSTTAQVSHVDLVNTLGQQVAVNQPQQDGIGNYATRFALQDYQSGVYYVRIHTDRGMQVRRVVLVD